MRIYAIALAIAAGMTGCATQTVIEARPAEPAKVLASEAGVDGRTLRGALCLSGGGYRAMLFNAGAVLAVEHVGRLGTIDTITSVSGGSILNGKLAIAWPKLRDDNSVRWKLENEVIEDIQRLADTTIDVTVVVRGSLDPTKTTSHLLAKSLDDRLYHNASLSDLPSPNVGKNPQTPMFIFQTTDLGSGRAWFFSNYSSIGGPGRHFKLLDIPLSAVVTASSAFPPIITPVVVDFGDAIERGHEFFLDRNDGGYGGPITTLAVELVGSTMRFTDGGIADNRGMRECERAGGSGIISDAAVFDTIDYSSEIGPLHVASRVADIVYSRAETQTTNHIIQTNSTQGIAKAILGGFDSAAFPVEDEIAYYDKLLKEPIMFGYKHFDSLLYWAEIRKKAAFLDTSVSVLNGDGRYLADHISEAICHAMVPTRLKKLDRHVQDNIINVGYLSALAAIELRSWSAIYKKHWLENPSGRGGRPNFFVLDFDPPRNASETLQKLGECKNQRWVDAFFVNAKNQMSEFVAVLESANTSGRLPVALMFNNDEMADEFGNAVFKALLEKGVLPSQTTD